MDATAAVPTPEPEVLLAAVRQHDQAAFTHLGASLDHEPIRLAYMIAGSREAAEGAAQAAWERLWQKPPRLRDASKLGPDLAIWEDVTQTVMYEASCFPGG